jgi:Cu(I)/Ag(I) efflux system membrane fusion protein
MNKRPQLLSSRSLWIAAVVVASAVVLALPASRHAVMDFLGLSSQTAEAEVAYTCPMHPEIRLPQMGDCPICGMSLVEKQTGGDDGSGTVAVTAKQRQLTGVTVQPVERRDLVRNVTAFGKIDYDETHLAVVSAWIDGRIDELYVDFTGVTVDKGHPLVWLYSPELISTQNEYLLAIDNLAQIESGGNQRAVGNARELVESARRRLLRWGLTVRQLEDLVQSRKIEDHIMIYAPEGGTVIERNAYKGMYVKEGDVLFRVADLTTVWLNVEVYEDDMPLLFEPREGDYYQCPMHPQRVSDGPKKCPDCGMDLIRTNDDVTASISARAFPGEEFEGKIAFTDPFLDPDTRTVRVRVNVANPDMKLKPNMYARATIRLPAGNVLSVPENAVLQSGSRTIVLVEESPGRFRPQPVRLGRMWLDDGALQDEEQRTLVFKSEARRYHEVLAGLGAGDAVVTSGNFLLGSESQLQGALAKMWAEDHPSEDVSASMTGSKFETEEQLDDILKAYYVIAVELTQDKRDGVSEPAQRIVKAARNQSISDAAGELTHAHHKQDLEAVRADFKVLSDLLIAYVAAHKSQFDTLPLLAYCPMKDASWLQSDGELLNPYYGSQMLRCGTFKTWE